MDFMMINDNNEDMIPDDNLLEELRASDKSPLWQIEILDQVADNAGNIDASNLNESDAYNQSCRNSIQVRICINILTVQIRVNLQLDTNYSLFFKEFYCEFLNKELIVKY